MVRCCPYRELDGVETSYKAFSRPVTLLDTSARRMFRLVFAGAAPFFTNPLGTFSRRSWMTRLGMGIANAKAKVEAREMKTDVASIPPGKLNGGDSVDKVDSDMVTP